MTLRCGAPTFLKPLSALCHWLFGIILICSFHQEGWTQIEANMEELRNRYPEEKTILLDYQKDVSMGVKGGKLVVSSSHLRRLASLRVKGAVYRDDLIPYDDGFYALKEISACTWIPNGESYRRIPVKDMSDVKQVENDSFYDSKRYKKFAYPSVTEGAVTECRYSYDVIDGVSIGAMNFRYSFPSHSLRLTVTCTDDVELGVCQFGDFSNITYTTERKGKSTIHTWTSKEVEGYPNDDLVICEDYVIPHLFVYPKSYKSGSGVVRLLGTESDLYRYNFQYVRDLLSDPPSGEIKAVVDSIRVKAAGEEDLVRRTYNWVQDHIRYVAFEDGMGAFVPRPAGSVISRRYGDCKDMANLLYSMLHYAGVKAHLGWVGTREIFYRIGDCPLPYAFNHMITVYEKSDGEYVFLDATSSNIRYGLPSYGIQGKEVMVCISGDEYRVIVVPDVGSEENALVDKVHVRLEGSALRIDGKAELSGYIRAFNDQRLVSLDPDHEKKELQEILHRGNNTCKLVNYSFADRNERNRPLQIEYEMMLNDYAKTFQNELFINPNFSKSVLTLKPDTADREAPVEFMFRFSEDNDYLFHIPDGYEVQKMPDNLDLKRDKYTFQYSFSKEEGGVRCESLVRLDGLYFEGEEVTRLVSDLNEVQQLLKQVIVFKKTDP